MMVMLAQTDLPPLPAPDAPFPAWLIWGGIVIWLTLPKVLPEAQRILNGFALLVQNIGAERKAKTDALTQIIEQNKQLFAELQRRDDIIDKGNNVFLESQRLNLQQHEQFNRDRESWKADMGKMVVTIETLTQENEHLKSLLAQYVTPEQAASPAASTAAASTPTDPIPFIDP